MRHAALLALLVLVHRCGGEGPSNTSLASQPACEGDSECQSNFYDTVYAEKGRRYSGHLFGWG